jgi:hypothetical protein
MEANMKLKKNAVDITGQRFGKLVAIKPVGRQSGKIVWEFLCDCGSTTQYMSWMPRTGSVVSCGCWRKRRDGLATTRAYQIWAKMIKRCDKANDKDYPNYGGRGIRVCERWKLFENFYADMGEALGKTTLDRIDNAEGYSKENCRWVLMKTQQNNKRTNVNITYQGITLTISEWAEKLNIGYSTLWRRLKRNLPLEKALVPHRLNGHSSICENKGITAK